MKIIIVGGGKVGLTLAESLRAEDHDIAVIDPDTDVVEYASTEYDILGIHGSGACCGDLKEAGADHADLLIATSPGDELNILSCVIASRMGTHRCIARVRDPDLVGQLPFMRDKLGLSAMVNPELYAAGEISRMIRMPSAIRVDSFAKGRIDLAEIKIEENSKLAGLKLSKLPSAFRSKLLICAVNRDNEVVIPGGDFDLQAGDKIHVTAPHADLASFFKELGYDRKIRTVMIVGGGRIAYYLAKQLLDSGIAVKIIEQDHERCLALSSVFPKAKIICADGTDQDILISEGIASVNAFVALTGVDEENIILSMYARQQGVGKVITKIDKPTLKQMTESVGLDSLISPKMLTANMIVQYVRAVQNSGGSSISTLYKLLDGQMEAIEFIAGEGSRVLDMPLSALQLKSNLLIAGIIRGGRVIIPSGGDCIEAEDSVIVVTANCYFRDLDEILM